MMRKIYCLILLTMLAWSGGHVSAQTSNQQLANMVEMDYSGKADTLTTVLIRQFLNAGKGTFWAVPRDQSNKDSETTYVYWQQAHAMDVIIYSYERIKEKNSSLANTYKRYMEAWFRNHANNWYHAENDPTGFVNEYTDDMCWICLTLLHMSEALGVDTYADTAKTLFDDYIEPRGWTDDDGYWGLPWKSNDRGRNACTNSPGCLVACKLYEKYADEHYRQVAINIWNYQNHVMTADLAGDGRVEDPPLTYTQGTFGEACRHLYHITGDDKYMKLGLKVIYYLCTSGRCVDSGILRHEGTSMDQSIFKAVAIPYIVNMALDEEATIGYRRLFVRFLQTNAKTLWSNLNLKKYPATYCNYYWAEPVDESAVPSMGAMTSGASLMEGAARMCLALTGGETAIDGVEQSRAHEPNIYSIDGRTVRAGADVCLLSKGLYIVDGRKVIVR